MLLLAKRLICLVCIMLSACAIIDIREDVQYSYQGGQIAKPLFSQVVPGVTTKTWLVENLGEPVSEVTDDNGLMELTYHYDEFVNSKTRILFLFYYRSTKVIPRQLTIALKDNVVSRVGPSYFDTVED